MSRIGRMPVAIPAGVTVTVGEGNLVTVKGPLGTLTEQFASVLTISVEGTEAIVTEIREKCGYTEFAGNNVEFHASGCITLPILGTKAKIEDKLAFDPDRSRRKVFYEEVKAAFPDYTVFIGGSSSFDLAPHPYNKLHALDRYCQENGITHADILFCGDDYGVGGNDEQVYKSDIDFVKVDDYTKLADYLSFLLED